jgi:type II secretory pathway pseudopilin PulG
MVPDLPRVMGEGGLRPPAPSNNSTRVCKATRGYSVLELMVVIGIVASMISIAVYSFMPARRVYGVDDAAGQVHRFMRDAATRALTHRQQARVFINTAATPIDVPSATPTISCPGRTIMLVDENTPGAGDEEEVRSEPLFLPDVVTIAQPANLPTATVRPAAPYNYSTAVFSSGTWDAYFNPSGTVTSSGGTAKSATLYFYAPSPTAPANASSLSLVRAITVFGPTGNVRFWRYNVTSESSASWVGR